MIHTTVSTSVAECERRARVGSAPHTGALLQCMPVVGAGGGSFSCNSRGVLRYRWIGPEDVVVCRPAPPAAAAVVVVVEEEEEERAVFPPLTVEVDTVLRTVPVLVAVLDEPGGPVIETESWSWSMDWRPDIVRLLVARRGREEAEDDDVEDDKDVEDEGGAPTPTPVLPLCPPGTGVLRPLPLVLPLIGLGPVVKLVVVAPGVTTPPPGWNVLAELAALRFM